MKKRAIYFFATVLFFSIISSSMINAVLYGNGEGPCFVSPSERHEDYLSFVNNEYIDAVEICGLCYACDTPTSGESDGVCPEDYAKVGSGGVIKRASCIDRPDADCVARIRGTVKKAEDAETISGATVVIVPPPASDIPTITKTTNNDGEFLLEELPAGRWVFRVSKPGFDTEVKEEIIEYGKTNLLDFYLPAGTCSSDCTNSFGRCSSDCEGINGCSYDNLLGRELCDGSFPGTQVIVNETGEFVVKYECCNAGILPDLEYRPRAVVHGNMEQLVISETVARMNNDVVKVKLAVWP